MDKQQALDIARELDRRALLYTSRGDHPLGDEDLSAVVNVLLQQPTGERCGDCGHKFCSLCMVSCCECDADLPARVATTGAGAGMERQTLHYWTPDEKGGCVHCDLDVMAHPETPKHNLPATVAAGEAEAGYRYLDWLRRRMGVNQLPTAPPCNHERETGKKVFGCFDCFPPTEATQEAVEAVCANCGREIHRAEDGYWRHDDRNFTDCVMFAVPRLADGAEAAQERFEKSKLIEDFNLEWAKRREAEQERNQLRAELTTARANVIRECVNVARMMSAGETFETGRQKALNIAVALESLTKGEGDDGPTNI
jgi:hypothetical protein